MKRDVKRFLVFLLCTAGLSVFALYPGASASSPDQTGWWWRPPTSGVPAPIPYPAPAVPDGGLLAGSSVDGPHAVGAVRMRVAADAESVVLTLTVHEAQNPEDAALVACPATRAWEPVDGGDWNDRPTSDCGRRALGVPVSNGTKWEFTLTGLITSSTIDVVVQPSDAASSPLGFEISFEAPDDRSVQVQLPPATRTSPPAEQPAPPRAVAPRASSLPAPLSSEAPAVVSEPPATIGVEPAAPLPSSDRVRAPVAPRKRALALVIGAAALAIAFWLSRRPTETDEPVGFGRFAGPRRGEAPAL